MARILIVDDDPDFVEIMRVILESRKHHVDAAGDVPQAFRAIEAYAPDLVLLDMMISFVLDGYTVARRMRETPQWAHIPILVVSSLTEAQCKDMCPSSEHIVDGWITKPVHPEKLFQQIEQFLSQAMSVR